MYFEGSQIMISKKKYCISLKIDFVLAWSFYTDPGLSRQCIMRHFIWSKYPFIRFGEILPFHFVSDEPNNGPDDKGDCVRLDASESYQWRDSNCNSRMGFICEHEHS